MHNLLFMHGANRTKLCDHVMQACVIPKANRSGKRSEASVGSAGHSMYLGPFHRAGSLSVADPDTDQPSTSGHPVDNRVDSLISRIRPARHSESRRHRVAQHVSKLVARCFSADHEVEAFMFGSVPLKTYLPDGDIDLSVFQAKGTSLRDSWATRLSALLEAEQRDLYATFVVKDIQVIHAEVKLLKCLVDNIVVDISFETLGGLCTVAFLEAMDRHIGIHHLFKRSVILVKAWCYYESRLLGAPHGLLSTYALETMVLYIFNFYHNSLQTPCQVLHKFLDVFSQFDWDKYCLSLQGPITLSSFPNPSVAAVESPLDTSPLLSSDTIAQMLSVYSPNPLPSDSPANMSASSRSFAIKFLNIMDPLLPTNNLGRSVSKASFARIRKALKHGAQVLTDILLEDEPRSLTAVDNFFKNTWNAQRPMAAKSPHSTQQQHSWQGANSKPTYGLQGISPQQLQYLSQQYQQQYMLQHLQLQQQQQQHQVHQMSRLQHQPPAYLDVYQADMLRDGQGRPQSVSKQQHRQSAAVNGGTRSHTEPPTRVASPFAVDSLTYQPAPKQTPTAHVSVPTSHPPSVTSVDAKPDMSIMCQLAGEGGDMVSSDIDPTQDASQSAVSPVEGVSGRDTSQEASLDLQSSDQPMPPTHSDQHKASAPSAIPTEAYDAVLGRAASADQGEADVRSQAGTAHVNEQPVQPETSAQTPQYSETPSDTVHSSSTAASQASAQQQMHSQSETSTQPQPIPRLQDHSTLHTQPDPLPAPSLQLPASSRSQLQLPLSQLQPQSQLQPIPQAQTHLQSTAQSESQSLPRSSSHLMPPPHDISQSHLFPQSNLSLLTVAESASSSQSPVGPQALPMPSYASGTLPMHMQVPLQGYGTHLHMQSLVGGQGDLYQYGMVPLLHSSMLMLPPQQQHQQHQQQHQQQQHGRGNRNGRSTASTTGTANGKYSPSAQHQQAFMMEMFPDLRQSYAPPQTVQADPQQLPDTASLPQPSSNDILAGNLDQLTLHLQIARGCHAQKLAASQSDIEGKQASAGQTDQAAAAQAHIQPNGALPVATQAAKQQRKPQPPPYVATQRGHQHVGPDRFASDRWLNDAQPPLHRSISPPVPQTYAASPLLQQQYAPQAFLHGTNREGSSQSQSAQHALQQQALRRGQQMQQQRLGGMPRQHAAPPRSSSADNLQRHAIRPDPNVAKPFHGGAAALHPSQAVPAQQAEASGQVPSQLLHMQDILRGQSPQGWMQGPEEKGFPGLPATPASLRVAMANGPASIDSPPVPQGIWGNGMHQQRISNLASDLPAVKTTAPSTAASESSAHASTPAAQGREVVPSSSRSAGSTPCAREQLPGRGYSPFDGPAPFQKPRQRMTHNASAQELSQPGGNMEGPARRERAPKLSLDSLTSQRPAEQAQRQQALANFDLQAEDFPALGGGKTSGALTPVTSLGQGRAAPGKAWSETDAVSPPLKISSVQK